MFDLSELTTLPYGTDSVTLNVTIVDPAGPGFVSVYPCESGRPKSSNGKYYFGLVVANAATVPVPEDRKICIYTLETAYIVVDLTAVYVAVDGGDDDCLVAPHPFVTIYNHQRHIRGNQPHRK